MKWFKKYFIPHSKNDYKPHLFRGSTVAILSVFIVLLFTVAVYGPRLLDRTDLTALVLPKVLVDYTNQDREKENYSHVVINPVLEKAAQMKADDMASKGYFAHTSPEGRSPWYWLSQVGYDFSFAGENLAVNFSDSVDVNNAWMNSSGHRANIMNGNFSEIGIATAEGTYQGKPTVFVVQFFGRPAQKNAVTQKTTTIVKPKTTKPPAVTSAKVLSESVSKENGEMFISVEKNSSEIEDKKVTYSTFVERFIFSAKKSFIIFYYLILAVLVSGLFLMVFIEIKRQHPKMIIFGLSLILLVASLLYVYQNFIFIPLVIA